MIPPFKLYFYPFLQCLSDEEERKLSSIAEFIADYFDMDEEDVSELTKHGSNTKHMSRVNYCATYLKKVGFVRSSMVGRYEILPEGLKILKEKGKDLTRDDLKVLPSYRNMQTKNADGKKVFIKSHYTKSGKFIPSYWSDIKNVRLSDREQVLKDTEEELRNKQEAK